MYSSKEDRNNSELALFHTYIKSCNDFYTEIKSNEYDYDFFKDQPIFSTEKSGTYLWENVKQQNIRKIVEKIKANTIEISSKNKNISVPKSKNIFKEKIKKITMNLRFSKL